MNEVTLAEAQQHLVKLVHELGHEGELLITEDSRPVAKLLPVSIPAGRVSLRNLKPASVGTVLRPFPAPDEDLFGEMLGAAQ